MRSQKAFTLIELMIAMAIITILATAGISAYVGYVKKGRDTARVSIANQVNTAVNALMGSNGGEPPSATELIAELERMNMTTAMNVIQSQPLYLSTLSDALGNFVGISSLFAASIREPSGGKAVCLGYDGTTGNVVGGQSCAFRYIVYSDGTYVIGYGVEHESSLQKNFYRIEAPTTLPDNTTPAPAPFFMQVVGTAGFVGVPSIGETDGPAPIATPVFTDSQITVAPDGETVTVNSLSGIVTDKSSLLSADDTSAGGGEVDACNSACTVGQACNTEEATCVNVCDGTECLVGQTCGASDTCIDLCGEVECQAGEVCVANACVDTNSCAGKSIGQACTGTTALYAGVSGNLNYQYMVGPSPEGGFMADWSAAQAACSAVTTYGFTGEWRLPTTEEQSLMLQPRGLITTQNWEWSSSESGISAWAGSASSGAYLHPKTFNYGRARCVRQYPCSNCSCPAGTTNCGGSCKIINTDNANCGGCGIVCSGGSLCTAGVCADPCAGKTVGQACNGTIAKYGGVYGGQKYMVAPNPETGFAANWSAAQTVCSAVTVYGYTGEWRLPTTQEQSLHLQPQGLINSPNWEWSSSVAPGANNAWAGYSGSPTANNFDKAFVYGRVRCVRTYQ